MRDLTRDNFGLLIAYVLPGFVALWGGSYHVEAVRPWLNATPSDAPTVGGFLYTTLASTTLGLTISGMRWAVVDRVLAGPGSAARHGISSSSRSVSPLTRFWSSITTATISFTLFSAHLARNISEFPFH